MINLSRLSKKQRNNFLKFSGMGFSMLGPILGGLYLGKYLDAEFGTSGWKIGLTLFGVFTGLYLALKDFIKQD